MPSGSLDYIPQLSHAEWLALSRLRSRVRSSFALSPQALLLVMALHIVLAVLLWPLLSPSLIQGVDEGARVEIIFIDSVPLAPPEAPSIEPIVDPIDLQSVAVAAPAPASPSSRTRELIAESENIMAAEFVVAPLGSGRTEPEKVLRLFNPNGGVWVPDNVQSAEPNAEFVAFNTRYKERVEDIYAKSNGVPYDPTTFESYWPSDNETLIDAFGRRATLKKTFKVGPTKVTCVWILIIGGCGW